MNVSVPRVVFSMFAITVAMALPGVIGSPAKADAEGDRLSWEGGIVTIPGNEKCSYRKIGDGDVQKNCLMNGVDAAKGKVPAVIFLHGCKGINNRQMNVMGLFPENGYATFMPNSMARPGRSDDCGRGSRNTYIRFDDIAYALSQIRKIPWIDQKRLVLAGFSYGGLAVAEYYDRKTVFKVRVIMGWGCRGRIPSVVDVPFLNLVGNFDDETSRGSQLCRMRDDNSLAKNVSSGHDVSEDSASAKLIGEFLKKFL